MALPLPNLDDRRWADLVDEGRSLIPLYSPGWTDHNVHDPGITLVELLAWMAELDLFRINRVPLPHIRKFLALVGIQPLPPRGARSVVAVRPAVPRIDLPAGLELEARDLAGGWVVFRTRDALSAVQLELQAVQAGDPSAIEDLTARWRRGEIVTMLGDEAAPGSAFYLGFDRPLPPGVPVTLHFRFAGGRSGWEERARIAEEERRALEACPPPGPVFPCRCGDDDDAPDMDDDAALEEPGTAVVPPHQSARVVWEIQIAPGVWQQLDAAAGEIADDTRSLTLDGRVVITTPAATAAARVGAVKTPLHYVRCRLAGGSHDAAPELAQVVVNGVAVEQIESQAATLPIAKGVAAGGSIPAPGEERALDAQWNDKDEIAALEFQTDRQPQVRVLEYVAPTASQPGRLTIEAAAAGTGSGEPFQRLALPKPSVHGGDIDLVAFEDGDAVKWTVRSDLDLSGRTGSDFLCDLQQGLISFGDGEAGRRLPGAARVFARYRSTRGSQGNLPAGRGWRIARTPHNEAVGGLAAILSGVESLANPVPAEGGAAAEAIEDAAARAVDAVEAPLRAVTLADYETLARSTPGVRLARASARANLDPSAPCLQATGVVTVIVLPYLPRRGPFPSAGTRRAVKRYLARRRLIGTRVEVVGPAYLEIVVRASVRALPGLDAEALRRRIVTALDRFFHPLVGGPDGEGWPFGRDVYRSEVLQAIDEVPGVDHVLSLEFVSGGGCDGPVCGNVCVGPIGLVASGRHEIAIA